MRWWCESFFATALEYGTFLSLSLPFLPSLLLLPLSTQTNNQPNNHTKTDTLVEPHSYTTGIYASIYLAC